MGYVTSLFARKVVAAAGGGVDAAQMLASIGIDPDAAWDPGQMIPDERYYEWAKDAHSRHPELPLFLQPGNPEVDPAVSVDPQALPDRLAWLTETAMADRRFAPRILPQLHVLFWGNKRGV